MKKSKKPEDPRQKIRIYRDGLELIGEYFIDPGRKVIDLDVYLTPTKPDVTLHMNYPEKRVES